MATALLTRKSKVRKRSMKLSEAIRLGASFRPQGFGAFFTAGGMSCALGAAYEATFGTPPKYVLVGLAGRSGKKRQFKLSTTDYEAFFRRFPQLSCRRSRRGKCFVTTLKDYITCLNDGYRYSREHIADTLEELGF